MVSSMKGSQELKIAAKGAKAQAAYRIINNHYSYSFPANYFKKMRKINFYRMLLCVVAIVASSISALFITENITAIITFVIYCSGFLLFLVSAFKECELYYLSKDD